MPNRFGVLNVGMTCLRHWWRVDRIRVSPNEGRLMNIQASALLEIAGAVWRVQSRHQDTVHGQVTICYICVKGDEMGELRIFMSSRDDWQRKVFWVREGDACILEESSVTVYASLC